jgi:glutamine synthetase
MNERLLKHCTALLRHHKIEMAGLKCIDGVLNKIDPVKEGYGPFDKNVLDESSPGHIHFLPRNLDEALDPLAVDQDFLKRGGVFSKELIDQWVGLKEKEIRSIGTMPHPFEYKLYFNL